jgi:hypothetical protein
MRCKKMEDKKYRVTDNGLSLLESALKYLDEQHQRGDLRDPQIKLMILQVRDKLTWFLGNEIIEVDSAEIKEEVSSVQ